MPTRAEKRGPIKWETRYVATDYFSGKRVASERTQGACVKLAKEYSAKHNVRLSVAVEKIAFSSSQHLGKVCPGRGVVGRWRFFMRISLLIRENGSGWRFKSWATAYHI